MPTGAIFSLLFLLSFVVWPLPAKAADISQADAVRIARSCTNGGEVLSPVSRSADAYVFKVLVGSQVRTVRVDSQGRCS